MPSCFSLTRKGDTEPSNLQHIDRCICQALEIPYSEDRWACDWYGFIGLLLATGQSFEKIIDICWDGPYYDLLGIAAYLNENYTSNSWKEFK